MDWISAYRDEYGSPYENIIMARPKLYGLNPVWISKQEMYVKLAHCVFNVESLCL